MSKIRPGYSARWACACRRSRQQRAARYWPSRPKRSSIEPSQSRPPSAARPRWMQTTSSDSSRSYATTAPPSRSASSGRGQQYGGADLECDRRGCRVSCHLGSRRAPVPRTTAHAGHRRHIGCRPDFRVNGISTRLTASDSSAQSRNPGRTRGSAAMPENFAGIYASL